MIESAGRVIPGGRPASVIAAKQLFDMGRAPGPHLGRDRNGCQSAVTFCQFSAVELVRSS